MRLWVLTKGRQYILVKSPLVKLTIGMQRFLSRKLSGNTLATRIRPAKPPQRPCKPTFIFDPDGRFMYYWKCLVSLAFLYNLWILGYRYAFHEVNLNNMAAWMSLDYTVDLVYLCDIFVALRTGFLEDGVLQTSADKLRVHYFNTPRCYLDFLSLLPLDLLYLSWGFCSLFRAFRLVKIYRFFEFNDCAERHSNWPNLYRLFLLMHWFLALFHWNACLIYTFRRDLHFHIFDILPELHSANQTWSNEDNVLNYLIAFYASGKILTLSEIPTPTSPTKRCMAFVAFELFLGAVVLAAMLGFVAATVASSSTAKKNFQTELDAVKNYMSFHDVPGYLQCKVVRWFDYLWNTQRSYGTGNPMHSLPKKLQAEISLNVHLDTLKKVEIFQNTEPGFLQELVLRLQPLLCSPGDFVCRKGEVGKEMYIVSHGKLKVLSDDCNIVLATLKAGSYFGEIAILNMGVEGNRRTASVISVGYSDLFILTKDAIWEVLRDYPAARMRLQQIAQKRLRLKRTSDQFIDMAAHSQIKNAISAPDRLDDISPRSSFDHILPPPSSRSLCRTPLLLSPTASLGRDPRSRPYAHHHARPHDTATTHKTGYNNSVHPSPLARRKNSPPISELVAEVYLPDTPPCLVLNGEESII